MPKNIYHVWEEQWKNWSPLRRAVFNHQLTMLRQRVDQLIPLPGAKLKPKHWNSLTWNCAWIMAEEAEKMGLTLPPPPVKEKRHG